MMTYGWAILIIVIVAVILYSMGIFNPSSSITFTSSGFSPFTVSSSLCNNIGYKIAVLAGPIPNNANYITINKVFVTSATGANATTASYTLTNPVTLKSGQSATILIPNVACTAAKVHYSLSAKIQYSYTASTLGLQTINTTGTVAGTSITGKPSTLTSYEPITITNTQSSATPNPFQQMVNFTSSDNGWTSISTDNFGQNVEFFYYNGTVIPSWLQNYTSGYALWWLKIAAIPAGSSETVYVGFAPASTNLFNTVNDGEAPQIPCGSTPTSSCSNYAEYDDGVKVFSGNNKLNFYTDFINSDGLIYENEVTINNGLREVGYNPTNGQHSMVVTSLNANADQITAYLGATFNDLNQSVLVFMVAGTGFVGGYGGYEAQIYPYVTSSSYSFTPSNFNIFKMYALNLSSGYTSFVQINNGPVINASYSYPPISRVDGSIMIRDNFDASYLIIIPTPPNGVMPSVSFGSVQ